MSSENRFQIFRGKDAHTVVETAQKGYPLTPVQSEGRKRMVEAGCLDGSEALLLVNLPGSGDVPGLSLVYVWFKANYPVVLHSHNVDCLYYVIAGSVEMGTKTLGPRDSFLLPSGAPYRYRVGPEGVELLEVRQSHEWDFVNRATGAAFYDRAVGIVETHVANWRRAKRPSER